MADILLWETGKSVSLLCREGEVLAVNSQEEIRSQKVIIRHEVSFSCQKW